MADNDGEEEERIREIEREIEQPRERERFLATKKENRISQYQST